VTCKNNQNATKQSILVLSSPSQIWFIRFFWICFTADRSPSVIFFFSSAPCAARQGGTAEGVVSLLEAVSWVCWPVGCCCRWRLFGGRGRKDLLAEAGAVGLRRWGTALPVLWSMEMRLSCDAACGRLMEGESWSVG
jgi:hypothetical protein